MPQPGANTILHTETLHASCVALNGHAALILGASGAGKSGLALQLMALGACLVADDRTILRRHEDVLIADAPPAIVGQIEARGVGILATEPCGPAPVRLIVDLDAEETTRLPQFHHRQIMGVTLPVIRKSGSAHFPAAVLLYLQGDRLA